MPRIRAQILKGFRDYHPPEMGARLRMMDVARRLFERYGFAPLDTPTMEYAEVLLGKYGEEGEKQIYRWKDSGDRDVCLRFDLTVPLARFVAMNPALPRPFKRYHVGNVFRGEHPRAGRYREFAQCDIDVVGTRSLTADAEVAAVGAQLLAELDVPGFQLRVNHRGVLDALLRHLGLVEPARIGATFRTLDKVDKIGPEETRRILTTEVLLGLGEEERRVDELFRFLDRSLSTAATVDLLGTTMPDEPALGELRAFLELVSGPYGVPGDRVKVDLSIARGIDYYTGMVFETFLADRPDFGSVMSGGRYDKLIGSMVGDDVPAVGISMGLDRLLAALEAMGKLAMRPTPSAVLVVAFGREGFAPAAALAARLREAGINAEVSHEHVKVGPQFKYADKKGIPFALTQGDEERSRGVVKLKELASGSEEELALDAAIARLAGR